LDAVALVLNLGEGKVDFGDDASDIEALDVANAAVVFGLEVFADGGETLVVTGGEGSGGSDGGGHDGEGDWEMHFC